MLYLTISVVQAEVTVTPGGVVAVSAVQMDLVFLNNPTTHQFAGGSGTMRAAGFRFKGGD